MEENGHFNPLQKTGVSRQPEAFRRKTRFGSITSPDFYLITGFIRDIRGRWRWKHYPTAQWRKGNF